MHFSYRVRTVRLLLGFVVVLSLLLLPVAHASASTNNFIHFSNITVDCGVGIATLNAELMLQAGSLFRTTMVQTSESAGDTSDIFEGIVPETEIFSGALTPPVPLDGSLEITMEVRNPDGSLAASSTLYAECPSGIGWTTNTSGEPTSPQSVSALHTTAASTAPGLLPPASAARAPAIVLADTPLYAEANTATVLPDLLLTAGQMWFVVGSSTDADGNVWYELFVGSIRTAYVPASVMSLEGPLPD